MGHSQCMLQYRQYYDNKSKVYTDLQGLPSHQTLAIPTWGCVFIASRDGTPAAYSIAYATRVISDWRPSIVVAPGSEPGLRGNCDRL